MKTTKMETDPSKYVVLDVETNGLSIKNDLLSISIFKPDTKTEYVRYLPLELDTYIPYDIKKINGISEEQLSGLKPLSQEDVDALIGEFELISRTILHYGNLDTKFLKNYFTRHKLTGFEKFHFFNFKQLICSYTFPKLTISKDNLCEMFGIKGVTETHTGINDCKLEWQLFLKIQGEPLLAINKGIGVSFYRMTPDYWLPASYIDKYPNLKHNIALPKLSCKTSNIFQISLSSDTLERYGSNIDGLVLEKILAQQLNAEEQENAINSILNFKKLIKIGRIEGKHIEHGAAINGNPEYSIAFNNDASVRTITSKETSESHNFKREPEYINRINQSVAKYKIALAPLVDFIKSQIFCNHKVLFQEVVKNDEYQIISHCDFSSDNAILEMKTYSAKIDNCKYQLFFEANGRKCYWLRFEWNYNDSDRLDSITIRIDQVDFAIKEDTTPENGFRVPPALTKALSDLPIECVHYLDSRSPVILRCKKCGYEWQTTYDHIRRSYNYCSRCEWQNRLSNKRHN